MSWQATGDRTAIALLMGSDPRRAPRGLNEWSYLREEAGTEGAEVFAVRTLNDTPAHPADAGTDQASGSGFSALCASMKSTRVESLTARLPRGPDFTYHDVGALLDRVGGVPRWMPRTIEGPDGMSPGFLTALGRLMRAAAADPRAPSPHLTYAYDNALQDISLRRVQVQAEGKVGKKTFPHLIRAEVVIQNRATRVSTTFAIAFQGDGPEAFVPVQIVYQPRWWLRVELQRDDAADVPADPGRDARLLARIRDICTAAARPR